MVLELKLRKIGNSVGVVFPKEVLAHLKVEEGDTIVLTEASQESVLLQANRKDFATKMAIVDDLCKRYRNTLRELAK
jgi:putative addiction module antidote